MSADKEIIFMTPVFKETLWGGDRLKKEFAYEIPSEHTGECWAISAHEHGDCTVSEGTWAGKQLTWLWENQKQLFGNLEGDTFPLLLKMIDAKDDLSIQVHPDDAYASVQENGAMGKTECWYILDCDEDATIVVGHHAKTREELNSMIDEKRWEDLICEMPIKKGDFMQIEPGTVHAIKAGTLVFETQQNSDITYRLYDYDRLTDGKPRELHLDKSKAVITVPAKENPITHTGKAAVEELVSCPFYKVWKYEITEPMRIHQEYPFMMVSVIDGEGTIDGRELKKGTHFILPCGYGEFVLDGKMTVIASTVN